MSLFATALPAEDGLELPPEEIIFGRTEAMALVRRQVENAASADVPVLIGGASGTGKEVIAKLVHRRSASRPGAFVKVSCPAIPAALLESELFGYERGAFTGAYAAKPGRVETAEGGTLFLDEIAELEPALQAKLLQLLQDGSFCRIGARQDRSLEVRVLCATNHDLATDVRAGTFRLDLFYRVNVLSLHLPSLGERREDIPTLVRYLTEKYSARYGKRPPPISKRMLQRLAVQPWPGNIRQLENVLKRYVLLGSEEAFVDSHLDAPADDGRHRSGLGQPGEVFPGGTGSSGGLRQTMKRLEREIILGALDAHGWNRCRTARALGVSYPTLLYKMREAGIPSTRRLRARNVARDFRLLRSMEPATEKGERT